MEISDLGRKNETIQTREALRTSTNFLFFFFFFYKEKVKSKIEYLKLIKFLKNFFNQIKNTWSYLATALFSLLKHNLTVTDSR